MTSRGDAFSCHGETAGNSGNTGNTGNTGGIKK